VDGLIPIDKRTKQFAIRMASLNQNLLIQSTYTRVIHQPQAAAQRAVVTVPLESGGC